LILLDSFPVPKVKTYTLEVMISIWIWFKAKLKRFYFFYTKLLKIVFWGIRKLKVSKSYFYGKESIKIVIQIGDYIYESGLVEMNYSFENFLTVHKRETIVILLSFLNKYRWSLVKFKNIFHLTELARGNGIQAALEYSVYSREFD
jgi:hypothetical protein